MKVLVVYATKSGCTQGIGERIGADLAKHGVTVDIVPAKAAGDPVGYDVVVLGSGVRAGRWHADARKWAEAHGGALREMPVAFYTCGLTMTDKGKSDEVRAYTDPIIAATGIKPVDIGLFAGWNEPEKFGFAERTVMSLMKAPEGDFRDWVAIDAWAETVASATGIDG